MPTVPAPRPSPVVSVVIPCHNAGQWIPHAVTSALAQSGVQTEVIVVDDGSTDQSREVLSTFAQRIRVLDNPVRGGNRARNTGLAAATGEWVQFLDADDYLEPDKIARQLAEAGDAVTTADVLYGPVLVETWRDKRAVERRPAAIDTQTDLFTQWITWQLPQTGGALWRRESLLRIHGWKDDQPCCQEHELYLRALLAGLRFHHCPTAGAVYRIWSEDTVCRRDPLRVIREKTRLIDSLIDRLRGQRALQPAQHSAAAQACFEMARTWAVHDLSAACAYHHERRRRDLLLARGPAAPAGYRLAHRLLGFRLAETLARLLR